MTNREFLTVLSNEVKSLAHEFSTDSSRAFLLWLGKVALELEVDDAFAAANIEGANDKGIDLFWVDKDHDRVIIIQGKYSANGNYQAKERELNTLLGCTDWLDSPEQLRRDGKPELAEAAEEYLEAAERGFSTELWFAYCGSSNKNLEKRARVFNDNKINQERHHSCRILALDDVREFYEEVTGPRRRVASATLAINPKLAFEQSSNAYGKALVATVTGDSLSKLYSEHGDRLFDRNVRLFLGAKRGSVNAGIFETLADEHERERFWAYNNGINVVCDRFHVDEVKETLTLENFSIVNGCQTTVALAKNAEKLTSQVQVLIKIICPPEAVIDPIIRYTNSQNQIKVWDILSQDRIQRRLQREFSSLRKPYYYVLRRGELSRLTREEKVKYRDDGRIRTIKHDLLAQYLAAFSGNPWAAYREKSLLFTKYYDQVFPATLRVEEALFVWIAGELITEEVHGAIRDAVSQTRETRVKILKRGGRLFALGCFGLIAKLRNSSDFLRSITEERIVSKRGLDRLRKYAKIATLWYADAARDLMQITNNEIGILIRSKEYFEKISDRLKSIYETASVNAEWVKGALPVLF